MEMTNTHKPPLYLWNIFYSVFEKFKFTCVWSDWTYINKSSDSPMCDQIELKEQKLKFIQCYQFELKDNCV